MIGRALTNLWPLLFASGRIPWTALPSTIANQSKMARKGKCMTGGNVRRHARVGVTHFCSSGKLQLVSLARSCSLAIGCGLPPTAAHPCDPAPCSPNHPHHLAQLQVVPPVRGATRDRAQTPTNAPRPLANQRPWRINGMFLPTCNVHHAVLFTHMSQRWEPDATRQVASMSRTMTGLAGCCLVAAILHLATRLLAAIDGPQCHPLASVPSFTA